MPARALAAILPRCWRRHRASPRVFWYFVHIFNQIELGLERLNDSPRRNAVTPSARAAALRSTPCALGDEPGAGRGIIGVGGGRLGQAKSSVAEAAADRAQRRAQDRSPRQNRQRPPPKIPLPSRRAAPAAAALAPATRQHAALPPPRKPPPPRPRSPRRHRPRRPTPMRWRTSSSWCASTSRRTRPRPRRPSSDPVARKLAEWIILRSDDNGASVERYRAFIAGQSELAVADLPAPAPRGRAVGRPSRRCHGVGVVRKRIAAVGQGQVRAGARRCSRAATAPMPSVWCARPGATIRCPRTPRTPRSTCSARC